MVFGIGKYAAHTLETSAQLAAFGLLQPEGIAALYGETLGSFIFGAEGNAAWGIADARFKLIKKFSKISAGKKLMPSYGFFSSKPVDFGVVQTPVVTTKKRKHEDDEDDIIESTEAHPSKKHRFHNHHHHHHPRQYHHHHLNTGMKYGYRSRKGSSKSLLRRRRRRARARRLSIYPAPEFKTNFYNPDGWNPVGQIAGSFFNGSYGNRIDPQIDPGTGSTERIGTWATLKSMFFDFQFKNQENATIDNRLIIDVWHKPQGALMLHNSSSVATVQSDFITSYIYENNQLVTDGNDAGSGAANCIDIGSRRNERNSNQFKLLHRQLVVIPGKVDPSQHARMVRVQFYLNKMLKMHWNSSDFPDGAVTVNKRCDNMGLYLCIRADLGNCNSGDAGTGSSWDNVPIKDPLTGVDFNYCIKSKFYDN